MVDDLDGVLARAAAEGVTPLGRNDEDPSGRFAWLIDPAGFKIELWEPGADAPETASEPPVESVPTVETTLAIEAHAAPVDGAAQDTNREAGGTGP